MGREYHIVADGCVEKKFEVGVGECGVLAWCWGCCGVPGKPAWQPLRVWFHPLIAGHLASASSAMCGYGWRYFVSWIGS